MELARGSKNRVLRQFEDHSFVYCLLFACYKLDPLYNS
jgi:hypothetical protein